MRVVLAYSLLDERASKSDERVSRTPSFFQTVIRMKLNSLDIVGSWDFGLTLDEHTVKSDFLGYDGAGNPQFDTTRSEIGELLYRAKYGGDRKVIGELAAVTARTLLRRKLNVDVVLAVPPSKARTFQPLIAIAKAVAAELEVPFDETSLKKVKDTPELKSMADNAERKKALADAFEIAAGRFEGKRVLLVDDLYRSGATLAAVARAVKKTGKASYIAVVALTRTRTRA
jgi:competence protein ComFC